MPDGILRSRAYELQLQLRHERIRTRELFRSWRMNIQARAPLSFAVLSDRIERAVTDIEEIERSARAATLSSDQVRELWERFTTVLEARGRYKELLDQLVTCYNERVENKKVFTTSEPYIRLGAQLAILDAVNEAADRLVASYCGSVNAQFRGEFPVLTHPNGEKFAAVGWEGVVSSILEKEFDSTPALGIIRLPAGMKSLAHRLLTPLAHEVGHYWLELFPKLNSAPPSDMQYWLLLQHDFAAAVLESGHAPAQRIVPPFSEYLTLDDGARAKLLRDIAERLAIAVDELELRESLQVRALDACQELWCDIYAWATAGPGYFTDLVRIIYRPTALSTFQGCHPLELERLRVGHELALRHPSKPSENKWFAEYTRGEPRSWDEAIARDVREHEQTDEQLGLRELRDEILGRAGNDDEARLAGVHLDMSKRVARALRAGDYDIRLHEFLRDAFAPSPVFVRDLSADTQRAAFDECVRVASAIWFEAQVVTGVRPSIIAAASTIIPIIRRPFFPSDKLYHSILLSDVQEHKVAKGMPTPIVPEPR